MIQRYIVGGIMVMVLGLLPFGAWASTLSLSPATGVYTTGSTFTVRIVLNTKGATINAADGTLSFSPNELSVVSLSKASSIFSLWTAEPSFSNSAGTISFSGGVPSGYSGSAGTVMSVTFRTLTAGTPRVTMSGGSVLAADGRGTNVLTAMASGAYTVSAVTSTPEPEAIVEYVPPANTPAAPKVTSATHGDPAAWSRSTTAELAWTLPAGVTAVRTLLDESPVSVPSKVYDDPIDSLTLTDLDEGVSYFHIQFQNADGWGKVAHYRLAVDSSAPTGLSVTLAPGANLANPTQQLLATTTDTAGAPLAKYKVQVNGGAPVEIVDTEGKGSLTVNNLAPGPQSLTIEAIDAAGNSAVTTLSFTIEAFPAPIFTEAPLSMSPGVIPVFVGTTRPRATVEINFAVDGTEPRQYTATADETGTFRFIPDGALTTGVYTIEARARDEFGAMSEVSTPLRVAVQESGLVRVGAMAIDVLSVIIPLIALLTILVMGLSLLFLRFKRFRAVVRREAVEAEASVHAEFAKVRSVLAKHEALLRGGRKTQKLTAGETALFSEVRAVVEAAEVEAADEVDDVTALVNKSTR